MGNIFQELPDHVSEVDVILAGGGTCACVIAGRLAEADPQLSILIIEQGPNNLDVPTIKHPALFMNGLLPTSNATLFYKSKAEEQLNNRELVVPSGGTLGGGSSINLMMYARAQRSDFDAWNVPGWSADDMIPYLRKLETYLGPGPKTVHGDNGPIVVSEGTYRANRSTRDFIQAAGRVGYPEIDDLSSLDSNNGVQAALHYIGPDGVRQDAAYRYIHPKIQSGEYPGLNVLVDTQVNRVVFDGSKRAIGVEFRPNPKTQTNSTMRTVKANKMVIVTCGALGTPAVLERSGIGKPEILEKAGIQVVSALADVGEHYQDHHLITYPYYSSVSETETLDALFSGRLDAGEAIRDNAPILGWNAQDVTGKLRPTSSSQISRLGPSFQKIWDEQYKNDPNRPLMLTALVNFFPADPTLVPAGQYLTSSVFTGYPLSRGSIHITSASLDAPPDFRTGFLSDPDNVDILKHVWAYKTQREIFRRMESYRGEVELLHPKFAAGSRAAVGGRVEEGVEGKREGEGEVEGEIVYTDEDDEVIKQWVRENVGTTWHSMGTCRMGCEGEAVVDPSLSVYGVEGLKIADLSIPPLNVAANTLNTAFAIGEKAADIFIKELGLI
ncbi:alcohol oxidase [Periconia macrospinosa]|uniref:Alcohol oxidase n=1 Tax=Periconia macrospinosa TaxID=97972 RepID=A0A2V1DN08_9PLEO|nr:alcohol oxidase [Periconia macrospinosa]